MAKTTDARPLQLPGNDREAKTLPRVERRGRPTSCTKELLEELAGHIREGALPKTAFLAMGLSQSSWQRWNDAADDPKADPIYHEFRLVCEGTHALCRMAVAKKMYSVAMEGDGTNWSKHAGLEGIGTNRVELSGPGGGAIPVEHSQEGLVASLLDEFAAMNERLLAKGKKK